MKNLLVRGLPHWRLMRRPASRDRATIGVIQSAVKGPTGTYMCFIRAIGRIICRQCVVHLALQTKWVRGTARARGAREAGKSAEYHMLDQVGQFQLFIKHSNHTYHHPFHHIKLTVGYT